MFIERKSFEKTPTLRTVRPNEITFGSQTETIGEQVFHIF